MIHPTGSGDDGEHLISGNCDHSLAYVVRQTSEAQGQNEDSHTSVPLQFLFYSKRDGAFCSHFPKSFRDGLGRRNGYNRRQQGTLRKTGFRIH